MSLAFWPTEVWFDDWTPVVFEPCWPLNAPPVVLVRPVEVFGLWLKARKKRKKREGKWSITSPSHSSAQNDSPALSPEMGLVSRLWMVAVPYWDWELSAVP